MKNDTVRNEVIAIVGWVALVQGGLGAGGQIFGDKAWGLLQKWWDIPTAGYVVLALAGAALALWSETAKKRAKA
ncbi:MULTISPECIES: hypothetical protein [Streptomyces]|uniref:hypothetical protein n=1 Tax=Streptomyces TaxID=1883 RepID=UPI0013186BB6|nr:MULTISPECIES: hypothetical protein [Streptomyces]QGZ49534.1 hypothetical protein GPZ77_15155 [Streptomyces sp. QHH-9511]GGU08730.1 hypothetical protein GCM10010272_62260 [Streptomyces lateritius]